MGGAVASAPLERSQTEEDTSGGCRRAEPTGEEGEEGQSQPARAHQDSDDSDDDPILIPSTRFRGQGQRYVVISLMKTPLLFNSTSLKDFFIVSCH